MEIIDESPRLLTDGLYPEGETGHVEHPRSHSLSGNDSVTPNLG